MGIADVIPGISGGTLALILRIYDRLIAAINGLKPSLALTLWRTWRKKGFSSLMEDLKKAELFFLGFLGLGVLIGVVVSASFIPYCISTHTSLTFAVFLGLILPSLSVPYLSAKKHSMSGHLILLFGLAVIVLMSMYMKQNSAESLNEVASFAKVGLTLFASAFITICAMILPGVSGSFLLLLMGQYMLVISLVERVKSLVLSKSANASALDFTEAFSDWQCLALLGCFAAGCALGLPIMSRVIEKALKHAHDGMMMCLTGMIASAFYILWPFKDEAMKGLDKHWVLKAANIWPQQFPLKEGLFFLGALVLSLTLVIIDFKINGKPGAKKK